MYGHADIAPLFQEELASSRGQEARAPIHPETGILFETRAVYGYLCCSLPFITVVTSPAVALSVRAAVGVIYSLFRISINSASTWTTMCALSIAT